MVPLLISVSFNNTAGLHISLSDFFISIHQVKDILIGLLLEFNDPDAIFLQGGGGGNIWFSF